jgi:hypothetical protein
VDSDCKPELLHSHDAPALISVARSYYYYCAVSLAAWLEKQSKKLAFLDGILLAQYKGKQISSFVAYGNLSAKRGNAS